MIEAVIGLGANLQEPLQQLQRALTALSAHPHIRRVATSSFYSSTPMGPHQQPDYVNAVTIIETDLAPLALLDALQAIELSQGRERLLHWGPRTLDLDILFYADQTIANQRLQVPHPGVLAREFVVVPLAEIRPDYILPNGQPAQRYSQSIDLKGLRALEERTSQTGF